MEAIAGQIYKLKTPNWTKTYGQGDPPTAMKLTFGERTIELEFGKEFKASDNCDSQNEPPVANIASGLLRCNIIEEHADMFELVEDAEEETEADEEEVEEQ